ncbi:hypothetical protein GJ744_004323 [Endocarpon pusillum]|uniref:Uncharacterized protein n=1 Tax=Endocarpon pusillum TaxID=364733 RepID=A0A8H7A826_9EURO|nr:hypothetical protein GJ744_004323 [Endocarpon pusillum]
MASPTFRLVNQTLVTAVGDFPAILSPSIAIFPPPPQGFEFGGPGETVAQFGAVYSCDNTGKQYIKLATESGISSSLTESFSAYFFGPPILSFPLFLERGPKR